MNTETTARLLISCDDKPGIVATVSNFLYHHGANITALDQHSSDPEDGTFLMRLEFQTPHLNTSQSLLEQSFAESVAKPYRAPLFIRDNSGWIQKLPDQGKKRT